MNFRGDKRLDDLRIFVKLTLLIMKIKKLEQKMKMLNIYFFIFAYLK